MKFITWINENIWIISIITLLLGAFLTKHRNMVLKLSEIKAEHYSKLFKILYEYPLNNSDYYYQKTNVILYGSRSVIQKLAVVEKNGINIRDSKSQEELFDLIYEMKKDIERPSLTMTFLKRTLLKDKLKADVRNALFDYKRK